VPVVPPSIAELPESGLEVLAAVPGISTQTARALLAHFGSIGGLVRAGPEQWADVEGVGAVRAHALATALLNEKDPTRHPERGSTVP
jgi:ERCC4-type nuclease